MSWVSEILLGKGSRSQKQSGSLSEKKKDDQAARKPSWTVVSGTFWVSCAKQWKESLSACSHFTVPLNNISLNKGDTIHMKDLFHT